MVAPIPTSHPKPSSDPGGTRDGTDMPVRSWVDRLPRDMQPYARLMRLDRPIGTWLLLFPCWWSLVLAYDRLAWNWDSVGRLVVLFVLFGLGAVIMRGAGCTYNDITDRHFDAQVQRTRMRPIPFGQVSVRQAAVFMAIQLLVSLAILLSFNRFAIWVGVASLLLVFTYPLMKRITYWPQFVLGLAFNWGALLGWAAVRGTLEWPAFIMYAAGICWTLGYDTIYAHQDKEDDILVGIKSTALKLGAHTRPFLYSFYSATIVLLGVMAWLDGAGWVAYAVLALGGAQLLWQAARVNLDDAGDCLRKFKSNRLFGWIILIGLLVDLVLR